MVSGLPPISGNSLDLSERTNFGPVHFGAQPITLGGARTGGDSQFNILMWIALIATAYFVFYKGR